MVSTKYPPQVRGQSAWKASVEYASFTAASQAATSVAVAQGWPCEDMISEEGGLVLVCLLRSSRASGAGEMVRS